MSFISSALGVNNGYTAQNPAGATPQIVQQSDLVNNAKAANANYATTNTAQTNLANLLNAQAQGQGPNIANLQLQQATNQNNQQAAGQLASQRGMNPALAQRLIAQNQASNNQNAAGQAGVLRAQQQLSAQGQLGNVLAQQAGGANQNFAANEAGIGNQNSATVGATNSSNQVNAQIAQNNTNQNAGIVGSLIGGASSMFSGHAHGGEILNPEHHLEQLLISIGAKVHPEHLAFGGAPMNAIDPGLSQGAPNIFGGISPGGSSSPTSSDSALAAISAAPLPSGAAGVGGHARGGEIPVMLSPGELKIPPHNVEAVLKGKLKAKEAGEKIPGKAKVKGDNEKNDTYADYAASGTVIVPRTKADNDKDAREFLMALEKEKAKKNGPSGYAKILALQRKNAS